MQNTQRPVALILIGAGDPNDTPRMVSKQTIVIELLERAGDWSKSSAEQFDECPPGWKVTVGERYADALCFDEMLGVVTELTMPTPRPHLHWMRTKEEHKSQREIWRHLSEENKVEPPRNFPNGFRSWMETHYAFVWLINVWLDCHLQDDYMPEEDRRCPRYVIDAWEQGYMQALNDLAEELTDSFEERYSNRDGWMEGAFRQNTEVYFFGYKPQEVQL